MQSYKEEFQPASDWNEYVIEWAPDYVQWEVNGQVVRRDDSTESVDFLDKSCHLMMNFWTPTWSPWGDDLDDSDMPWYTRYDYVKVEKYNETYEPEDYVIHDPSHAVAAGDYGLMIAVTGKEQADGYRSGFLQIGG